MRHRKIKPAYRTGRRDYSKKRYFNSLFNVRKKALEKRKKKRRIGIIAFFLFFILIVFGIYYLLFGSYFRISDIKVHGNEDVKSGQILAFILNYLEKDKISPSYWTINNEYLSDKIKDNFHFKKVDVEKKLPNRLSIKIVERDSKFIISSGDDNYILDEQGVVMRSISEEEIEEFSNLLKIIDKTSTASSLKNQMISAKEIVFFYKISNFLSNHELKINFWEKEEHNGLTAILSNNIKIYFNTEESINKQLGKLEGIIDKLEGNSEYIDIRFGDKIYYK